MLVQLASMPKNEDLPQDIRPLTQNQAIELTDSRWDFDVSEIIRSLEKVLRHPKTLRVSRRAKATIVGCATYGWGFGVWTVSRDRNTISNTTSTNIPKTIDAPSTNLQKTPKTTSDAPSTDPQKPPKTTHPVTVADSVPVPDVQGLSVNAADIRLTVSSSMLEIQFITLLQTISQVWFTDRNLNQESACKKVRQLRSTS